MKALASKLSWLLFLFSLALVITGALLLNPIIFGVGGVLALCARSLRAPDLQVQSPEVQYWSRGLIFSALKVFGVGLFVGLGLSFLGFESLLKSPYALIFDAVLLGLLALLFLQTLPFLIESSWHLHLSASKRDDRVETHWSRFIVSASATGFFVSAVLVGLSAFT